MPINMIDGEFTDGKGDPIPHTVTKIKIGLPGEEIRIEDESGIEISKDPETGQTLIKAEKIEISSEKKPSIFRKWFGGGKER